MKVWRAGGLCGGRERGVSGVKDGFYWEAWVLGAFWE